MRKFILFLSSFLASGILVTYGQEKEIWALGIEDGSCLEFALAPGGKEKFVSAGFGSEEKYFLVGKNDPADFPYILPGPTAEWAGGTYWSGYAMVHLPIYMQLDKVQPDQEYLLRIAWTEAEIESGTFLRVTVNGQKFDLHVSSETKVLDYKIPGHVLITGINSLVIQLFYGKSFTFDAFTFRGPSQTTLIPFGTEPLVWLSMAEYEEENVGKDRTQPLLLDVRAEKDTELRIEIADTYFTKKS